MECKSFFYSRAAASLRLLFLVSSWEDVFLGKIRCFSSWEDDFVFVVKKTGAYRQFLPAARSYRAVGSGLGWDFAFKP